MAVSWVGTACIAVSMAAAAPEAKPAKFDIAARKQSQAWLWAAPRREPAPPVKNTRWALGPVDRFILHRLEEKGLVPAAAVDDRTWLRRVTFAITGLPPSREDIRTFLADADPGARERRVDRLLASPHFGERWARHWMDLVRYAETRGHESDFPIANAWHYRDYLIRAFNDGVPYDALLLEHLAGDLLPAPRIRRGTGGNESVLATGWPFLGEENHSPVDIRQDECDRLDNKVDVFTKTFLGLTVSCARCHDHKFDPISTQDYYALTGFMLGSSFRQVRFEAMENNRAMGGELRALRGSMLPGMSAALGGARRGAIPGIGDHLLAAAGGEAGNAALDPARVRAWAEQLRLAATNPLHVLHGFAIAARPGTAAANPQGPAALVPGGVPREARVIADFTRPGVQPWKADGEGFGTGPVRVGELVFGEGETNPIARVTTYGAARRDPFWSRLAPAPGNENDSGELAATSRSGQMVRTPTFTLAGGRLHYLVKGRTRAYAAVDSHLMLAGPLHRGLVQRFDTGTAPEPRWVTHELGAYSGHRTHVEFGPDGNGELEILMVVESPEVPRWTPVGWPVPAGAGPASLAERARGFQDAVAKACDWLGRAGSVEPSVETARMADWMVRNPALFGAGNDAATARLAGEYFRGERDIARRTQWESATAVAWFDGTGVDENVLVRGKPFKPGPVAPRSLPVAFSSARPITNPGSSGRHELARQLVDPENPLVARVAVNRVWHHLFGRGLVPTVDNFGALGEKPTHPELLDHLAWQFVHEDGWSVKRLIKRLVLTQTYSMGQRVGDPRAEEIDPTNGLWHHVPVRRLEAEAIRDSLLAVSGRLNPAVGGPPVPVHLTEFVIGRGRPDQSGPLDGNGRRSIYTAVRRNFLPTTMTAFDAPTPFSTVGRRNVTNVPAQSLALMNDPLFHQQARVWAERLLREMPGADAGARVGWLFESAYGRRPTAAETGACLESLAELRRLQGTGEDGVEVWADLCHSLLNANEFIYVL